MLKSLLFNSSTQTLESLQSLQSSAVTVTCLQSFCICFRRCPSSSFSWHSQFPIQAWTAPGTPLHLPGQARLGSVLLQDCAQGGSHWSRSQEPTSLHCYEPHRPKSGTSDTGGKSLIVGPLCLKANPKFLIKSFFHLNNYG